MESGNKIQKSDIKKVFWRFQLYGGSWNFERMQNVGFLYSIKPVLKRLYANKSKEEMSTAMKRHMEFFNTNPTMAAPIIGVTSALEEAGGNESGPAIEKPGEMAAILNGLQEGDVLFVDEIHRLNRQVEEVLYPAMEDFAIDIMIGKGSAARSIRLNLPKFTLVGATTRAGMLTAPLRDRFGVMHRLELYTPEELKTIILRSASVLNVEIEEDGALELARRSRGTPRLANRLLKRVRDFAQVKYDGKITKKVADYALDLLDVDKYGLDHIDRTILLTMIEKFQGGPVGLDTLAAAISEDAGTLEDVYEPYLLKNGFIQRTPRGRIVTDLAYRHLGIESFADE